MKAHTLLANVDYFEGEKGARTPGKLDKRAIFKHPTDSMSAMFGTWQNDTELATANSCEPHSAIRMI
jgi:hypothetical protein